MAPPRAHETGHALFARPLLQSSLQSKFNFKLLWNFKTCTLIPVSSSRCWRNFRSHCWNSKKSKLWIKCHKLRFGLELYWCKFTVRLLELYWCKFTVRLIQSFQFSTCWHTSKVEIQKNQFRTKYHWLGSQQIHSDACIGWAQDQSWSQAGNQMGTAKSLKSRDFACCSCCLYASVIFPLHVIKSKQCQLRTVTNQINLILGKQGSLDSCPENELQKPQLTKIELWMLKLSWVSESRLCEPKLKNWSYFTGQD